MASASLTISPDRPPVVTAANVTLGIGQASVTASSLFSATDPDGDSIATYAVKDTGSGHFVLNGVAQANNQEIDVTAAQLSQLTYQSVPGSSSVDNVQVRVNDGTLWSNWASFTVAAPPVVIESVGSTGLVLVGNNYFFDPVAGGTGPELKYNGAAVTVGEFSTYTPVGVEQTSSGYEVAFKNASAGQFSIWNTDSNGNFLSFMAYSGTSTALETLESSFHQDLNGDGVIGLPSPPPPTVIESFGSTSLVLVGNNYFFDPVAGGTGPELKYNGAAVTVGEFSPYTPVGVEQTSSGYEVAFKNASAGQFSIWNTDSNGTFLSFMAYSGTSTALESLESSFHQDLNGDGVIGLPSPPPPTVIESFGSTSLVQVGSNYFFNPVAGGSGPELKYNGAPVVVGDFSPYTPVGVEQTSGGYEVAFKNAGTIQFSIWNTDSNGNFLSFAAYSGTSTALETLETSFHQDLNADGVIGIYAAPSTTLQISNPLSGTSGAATIGAGATLELGAADSSSVTFSSSTGMLKLDSPTMFSGLINNFAGNGTLSGSDQIDLKGINSNSVQDSFSNGVLTVTAGASTFALDFNGSYTLANFKFANDGSGGTIVYDPPVPVNSGTGIGDPQTDTFRFGWHSLRPSDPASAPFHELQLKVEPMIVVEPAGLENHIHTDHNGTDWLSHVAGLHGDGFLLR
jgi:hypothetical protein